MITFFEGLETDIKFTFCSHRRFHGDQHEEPSYTYLSVPFRPLPYIAQERNDLSRTPMEADLFPYIFNSVFCICRTSNP